MTDVVALRKPDLYTAETFRAGSFAASGTLCGHIDFTGPFAGTYPISLDEASDIIFMLQRARADILNHSDPLGDPRIVWLLETAP